jgi:hypothetical protein
MALDSVIQELVDKAAIRELMMKYARGIDRRNLDLIASGFTPDAHTVGNQQKWDTFVKERSGGNGISGGRSHRVTRCHARPPPNRAADDQL